MNRIFNKETAKIVGNVSLRVGKDIVREGVKAVIFKSVVATSAHFAYGKTDAVKKMTLDDILGDITRKEKKMARKLARQAKRQAKIDLDIENLEEMKKVFNDLHGSNDEIVK